MSDDRRPGLVPDVGDPTPPTPETQLPALVEFLLDRLAEDEHTARAAGSDCGPEWRETDGFDGGPISEVEARHIARHDPARVLADVAAKRVVIDVIFRYEAKIDGEWACCHDPAEIRAGECSSTPVNEIEALRLLALPYADHPDYREEWRP